jgi:cell division protein FtsA
LSSGVILTGGGALVDGMTDIAEQVFDAPVRIGYPERDRFAGLIEDIQSPAWTTAAGLALVGQRSNPLETRPGGQKRGSGGRLGNLFSRLKNRTSSIF